MSFPSECGGCALRDHSRHDRDHGIRKGLIGGTYCPCTGECEDEGYETAAERLLRDLFVAPQQRILGGDA